MAELQLSKDWKFVLVPLDAKWFLCRLCRGTLCKVLRDYGDIGENSGKKFRANCTGAMFRNACLKCLQNSDSSSGTSRKFDHEIWKASYFKFTPTVMARREHEFILSHMAPRPTQFDSVNHCAGKRDRSFIPPHLQHFSKVMAFDWLSVSWRNRRKKSLESLRNQANSAWGLW